MSRIYVPLDIETTGLDSRNDEILEIGWGVLDEQFEVIVEPRSFLVDHDMWGDVWTQLRQAPQVVRDMHNRSGLAGDLLTKELSSKDFIANELVNDIRLGKSARVESTTAHLLGMSVAFDIKFLEAEAAFLPLFDDRTYGGIHHRSLDLTGIKLMYETLGWRVPEPKNETPHRALADVWESIHMARDLKTDLEGMIPA